jgi:hypothetical protein
MGMKKRHKTINPQRARQAAGGGGGSIYDRIIPAKATRTACSKCGTFSTLTGTDGERLRCRLERRKPAERSENLVDYNRGEGGMIFIL